MIRHVRMLRPDFVFSVGPWLRHEAHGDHLRTGHAVAEAALLYHLPRLRTTPTVDAAYEGHDLVGIALYFTADPTTVFDVGATRDRKHRALDAYAAQFTSDGLAALKRLVEASERRWAEGHPFSQGEPLKVVSPAQLHCAAQPGSR